MKPRENYSRHAAPSKSDPGQFFNFARYCVLCKAHKPQTGGSMRGLFGGRHWVCAEHPRRAAS